MKPKLVLIYVSMFCWFTLYANPLIDAYGKLNDIAVKFLLMGIVVPPVAIYMLYKDDNTCNPNWRDIAATAILSIVLIWMGYEVSVETFIPTWGGLIISFVLGLFSLPIVLKLKEKIVSGGGIIDKVFKELGKWITKKFGNEE